MYYSYKNAILILGLIFCTTITFSQTKEIDSLKNELQNHKTQDTLKVDLLYKLAFSHFQRDMKSTLLYLGEAEDLSNDLNYIKGKAKVLYLKGILESRKSNYTTSLNYFNKSLKHYQSINDKKGESAIYSAFGITHFIQSEFDEAIISYKKASNILEELGDHEEMIKQKPSKYGKSKKEQFKAFLDGFFSGVASPVLASLELMDRYVKCGECGLTTLENHGDEFK